VLRVILHVQRRESLEPQSAPYVDLASVGEVGQNKPLWRKFRCQIAFPKAAALPQCAKIPISAFEMR
jgi:hypothetical protein